MNKLKCLILPILALGTLNLTACNKGTEINYIHKLDNYYVLADNETLSVFIRGVQVVQFKGKEQETKYRDYGSYFVVETPKAKWRFTGEHSYVICNYTE